jgi:hypothetical protein
MQAGIGVARRGVAGREGGRGKGGGGRGGGGTHRRAPGPRIRIVRWTGRDSPVQSSTVHMDEAMWQVGLRADGTTPVESETPG